MRLGLDQVRAIASGLMLSVPPPGTAVHPVLPEVLLGAFITAVVGRNIGRMAGLANADEVFICSMLSRLGEILSIYYFPEEYDEIAAIAHNGKRRDLDASQFVLGISFDMLGIEVARHWNFSPNVIQAMRKLPEGVLPEAVSERDRIAHCAGFARELCDAAWRTPDLRHEEILTMLVAGFCATVPRAADNLAALINHSLDLGEKYCQVLGIDTNNSSLVAGLTKCSAVYEGGDSTSAKSVLTKGVPLAVARNVEPREVQANPKLDRTAGSMAGFTDWLKTAW